MSATPEGPEYAALPWCPLDPVHPDELVRKAYVDAAAGGGSIGNIPGLQASLDALTAQYNSLAAALAGKMPIAPTDGKQYAGAGSGWAEIEIEEEGGGGGGSGGGGSYTSNEAQIGTWIDGRQVWRKTITGTMPSTTGFFAIGNLDSAPAVVINVMTICRNFNDMWLSSDSNNNLSSSAFAACVLADGTINVARAGTSGYAGKMYIITVDYVRQ